MTTNQPVERDDDGGITLMLDGADNACEISPVEADAVRDLILDELGLWLDDETGLLVLTASWGGAGARTYDPANGASEWGYVEDPNDENADHAVARWRASLTPPPREPKQGEVWRVTLEDGSERNALACPATTAAGLPYFWVSGHWVATSSIPPDRRRLLVEADGTVVAGDE